VARAVTLPPLAAADADRFRDLLRARTGICLAESRTPDLRRAVAQAAAEADLCDADSVYELLMRRTEAGAPLDAFVAGLNVGETHFFRDANQIQAVQQHILPELIARRGRQRRLRVWSAGCSTGEEAYTLAILIHRLTSDLSGWDVLVLGTDINGRSLRLARRGVYRAWSLRGMPPSARACYLRPHGQDVEVAPSIRAMVTFAQLNLAGDGYPSPATNTHAMDLILCRNVLLYFGAAEARIVVRRLRDALQDGGWLLLGQVEAGLGVVDGLDRSSLVPAAFRRTRWPADGGEDGGEPGSEQAGAAPGFVPPNPGPATRAATPAAARVAPGAAPLAAPVAAGAAAPSGTAGPDPPGEATACARAVRFWRDGQQRLALGVLAVEADRNPLLPHVHYLSGLILLDGGRTAEALAAFRRCTYADPGFALGHLGQAGLLARSGRRQRAGTALDTAAQLVANLDPAAPLLDGDGPRVAEVSELIAAQRWLLGPGAGSKAGHG
jgi:chemotaxis protein methyltransferase CheR